MNTNTLEDFQCPKCGGIGPFNIECTVVMRVFDDGTEIDGDAEWNDESYCMCRECEHTGTVQDFQKATRIT